MVSAPVPNADFIGFIFQGSKTGPAVSTFKGMSTLQRGPTFFVTFSILVRSKSACSAGLLSDIGMVIPLANCWLLGSEVPLLGGQTAPRVQTSNIY